MSQLTSVALGVGAAGGLAQGIGNMLFGGKSQEQKALEQMSMEDFKRQRELATMLEQQIQGREGIQGQAQGTIGGLLSGEGFALTPEEQMRINQLSQARVQQGASQIDRMLDERLKNIQRQSAARGVRGQALSELQGQAVRGGAEALTDIVNQSNVLAAQQQMQLPQQRAALQANLGTNFSNFADALRQQALNNRTVTQNPALLSGLRQERLQSTPGPGVFDAISGGLSGAQATLGSVGNIRTALDKWDD